MGYLSSLQDNVDNFNLIKLSRDSNTKYDNHNGSINNLTSVGIFQLFSILIQLLDDMGDYKEDKNSNIITSIIFPIFNKPVINPNLSLQTIDNKYFENSLILPIFYYSPFLSYSQNK